MRLLLFQSSAEYVLRIYFHTLPIEHCTSERRIDLACGGGQHTSPCLSRILDLANEDDWDLLPKIYCACISFD